MKCSQIGNRMDCTTAESECGGQLTLNEVKNLIDHLFCLLRRLEQIASVQFVEGFEAVDIDVADHRLAPLLQQAFEALLDRHVAGKQGERIGVPRLLELFLGDQPEHVDHPAHARIVPAAGDDEIFLDTLACAASQQAADLLQGLAEFHGEKIVAHQAADRLAQEQVAGEGPEQGVGERVAMDDADGTPFFVEDRQGVQGWPGGGRFPPLPGSRCERRPRAVPAAAHAGRRARRWKTGWGRQRWAASVVRRSPGVPAGGRTDSLAPGRPPSR